MFDIDQLRDLGQTERVQLLRALVALESYDPVAERVGRRRRAIALLVILGCCVALAAWIGVLAVTLPKYYRSGGWRGAWVGFDFALLTAFAVTGWAAWRRRQVLIICLIVLATLLCCDAWFDVVLDAQTKGFELSLLSALFIELPLAAFAILGARRLLRMNVAVVRRYEGETGSVPSLRQVHLIGGAPGSHFSDLFRDCNEPEGKTMQAAGAQITPAAGAETAEAAEAAEETRPEAKVAAEETRPEAKVAAQNGSRDGPAD